MSSKGSVLFVTSRKAKVEADIANSTFSGTYRDNFNNNQLLVTNAKLASMVHKISNTHLQEIDDFIDHFDYIVIDEVHSLAADSIFAPSSGPVLSFMEYAANKGKVVIAMTGTPAPIEYYFRDNNWAIRDYRDECVYLHPQQVEIISKRSVLKTIILHLGKSKIIYFANKTNSITQLCKQLINDEHISANKISVIVARSREKEYMESLKAFSSNHGEIIETESQKTYESIINSKGVFSLSHYFFPLLHLHCKFKAQKEPPPCNQEGAKERGKGMSDYLSWAAFVPAPSAIFSRVSSARGPCCWGAHSASWQPS